MPVSTSAHLTHCSALIITLNPASVLDVGCGFGTWGFLCRTFLDVMPGRVQRDEWQVRIDGVEFFEPYIQQHQRWLYNDLIIGDIQDVVQRLDSYELIVAGDVIEHIEKGQAQQVLDALYARARRALIVNIPLAGDWDHPEAHGNPAELHRSQWTEEDFSRFPHDRKIFQMGCGTYGVFYLPKGGDAEARVHQLLNNAESLAAQDRIDEALDMVRQAKRLGSARRETVFMMADLFLRANLAQDAVDELAAAWQADPSFHEAELMRAKLLASLARREEAGLCLSELLGHEGLPGKIEEQARALLANMQGAG